MLHKPGDEHPTAPRYPGDSGVAILFGRILEEAISGAVIEVEIEAPPRKDTLLRCGSFVDIVSERWPARTLAVEMFKVNMIFENVISEFVG